MSWGPGHAVPGREGVSQVEPAKVLGPGRIQRRRSGVVLPGADISANCADMRTGKGGADPAFGAPRLLPGPVLPFRPWYRLGRRL